MKRNVDDEVVDNNHEEADAEHQQDDPTAVVNFGVWVRIHT